MRSDHLTASIVGFFNPKIFFDFTTRRLDCLLTPVPVLQALNMTSSLFMLALEWPLISLTGPVFYRSFALRFSAIPAAASLALLLHQGTNAALYYLIGLILYGKGYIRNEVWIPIDV